MVALTGSFGGPAVGTQQWIERNVSEALAGDALQRSQDALRIEVAQVIRRFVQPFQGRAHLSSRAEVQVHCIINSKIGSEWIDLLNQAVFVIGSEAIRNRAMCCYERS